MLKILRSKKQEMRISCVAIEKNNTVLLTGKQLLQRKTQ